MNAQIQDASQGRLCKANRVAAEQILTFAPEFYKITLSCVCSVRDGTSREKSWDNTRRLLHTSYFTPPRKSGRVKGRLASWFKGLLVDRLLATACSPE